MEFVVRNDDVISDWFVYWISGDSLTFCAEEIVTGWQSELQGTRFLGPGESALVKIWTRIDTLAVPNDTLSINCSVVGVSNPTLVDSCNVSVFVGDTPTSISSKNIAFSFGLHQNWPNPFNPSTRIDFTLDEAGPVSLKIYDISGRLVRTLVDESRSPKSYMEEWDGRDVAGNDVASGVYFIRLTARGNTITRKAVLVR
jgi:hypothetical protein